MADIAKVHAIFYKTEVAEIDYGIAGKADIIFLLGCYSKDELPIEEREECKILYLDEYAGEEFFEWHKEMVIDELARERKVKSNKPFMIIPADGNHAYISGWKAMFSLMSALDALKEYQAAKKEAEGETHAGA